MQSCLYHGRIRHRRFEPKAHSFNYPVFYAYLDLDELDNVFEGRWFWSTKGPAPVRFQRRDYLGDPGIPLQTAVRDHIRQETGHTPDGPIRYSRICDISDFRSTRSAFITASMPGLNVLRRSSRRSPTPHGTNGMPMSFQDIRVLHRPNIYVSGLERRFMFRHLCPWTFNMIGHSELPTHTFRCI